MAGRVRIDPSSRMPFEAEGTGHGADSAREVKVRPRGPGARGPAYVELTVRSNFSFLQAASPPERLVQRAAELGYDAVAITDRDGLYGAVRAMEEAEKRGLRLVLGSELTLEVSRGLPDRTVTVLVQDHEGYRNLCRLLTQSHARHHKGKPRTRERAGVRGRQRPRNLYAGLPLEALADPHGVRGLWVLLHEHEDAAHLTVLRSAFGERASLALARHLDGLDAARTRVALTAAKAHDVAIVAVNLVRFAEHHEKPVFDILHCIREGITLDEAGRDLPPNAEACLKPAEEMEQLFADLPNAVARSREIAEACRFSLNELRYRFPYEVEGSPEETPDQALRRLTYEGAHQRYGTAPSERVLAQIEKELELIARLDVAPYFLSVKTIVDMARRRDILCQGRGSAANSAVCFCLGVTAVDPARSNLLFERFLSAERHEPPDIDVDFEHDRREEVIQEIYERYGRERAAMVSEVVSYRGKSALREVGKVFGLSLEQVERLSATVSWFDPVRSVDRNRLVDAGFDPDDPRIEMAVAGARAIQGFPRHLSIHVGGFIISAEPLDRVAPVEPATMPDRTVIPWDKDDIDTLGFFKLDVLGLGILTAIRKALALASVDIPCLRADTAIDRLARIPAEDPAVYDALCRADTVGVFQIESRAQMAMLPRLRPRTFYDLVVEVAIVRPGPIQGGMIHPYLRRRNGEEPTDSPHASLTPILERTLGVPLFQEQVMQIAIVGAGYTGGEADQLRRDMAAWRKNGRLEAHRQRLLDGFQARGIALEFGERLYAQIQGFGEYGFPESHAASFALLVYASSWLKVHHPAAFAAALINSQPMGFYSVSTILQDAQRHGVRVLPVSVIDSAWDATLEQTSSSSENTVFVRALRVGLRQVKGLGEEAGRRIERARAERPFTSLEDVADRAALSKLDLQALAEAGAFAQLVPSTRAALWAVRAPRPPRDELLFAAGRTTDTAALPSFPALTRVEQLSLDYERTGLSASDHPMKIVRPRLPRSVAGSRGLQVARHGAPITVAGMVICRQRPATASGVVFVTMEDEHGFINLILYARVFDQFRHVATTSSLLLARGKVERASAGTPLPAGAEDVVYVVTRTLQSLELAGSDLPSMSRDFH